MRRILLLDEQVHVLRMIKLSLDRNGFDVDTALTQQQAESLLQQNRYDVLVTSLDMPGMDVQPLLDRLRAHENDRAPLLVALTSLVEDSRLPELREWAESREDVDLVEKPLSLRWMVARLTQYFGHYEKPVPYGHQ